MLTNNNNTSNPKAAPLTQAIIDTNYQNESESIANDNKARKWLSYLTEQTSSKNNMRAVAYLMDTDVWNVYKTDKADYAIGGPTLDMLFESYNNWFDTQYEIKITTAQGYQIRTDSEASWLTSCTGMLNDELYSLPSSSGATAMWLASPSAASSSPMVYSIYGGGVTGNKTDTTYCGFRPVVCLNSNVSITKIDDENFELN